MNRRRFISIGLAGGVTMFGTYVIWYSFEDAVRKILQQELSKLAISGDLLDHFMADSKKYHLWSQFSGSKKVLIKLHFLFRSAWIALPYYHKYLHYKNIIVGDFLFATDYFTMSEPTNRQIKYTGIFNPYKRFCSNPFSAV